ncbi:MAG: sugar phosphate isomerase/epimerase family protein [Bryobacteraceae bacterium]
MPDLKPLEAGVMFWAGRNALETVREVKGLGVRSGQLLIPGPVAADLPAAAEWKRALDSEGFRLVTLFAAYDGEDYTDVRTIQDTVGWIPPATRAQRLRRTFELSDFGCILGAPSIGLHVGFVPEDHNDSNYIAVREMTRMVCDYAASNGQTFALETGQEPAHVLLEFFRDVGRENLRINFDPANMIMYGTGDPIEALQVLGPHVVSVHAKDGTWPKKGDPRGLGGEEPLGKGDVGMERFVTALKKIGYRGTLNIEREIPDHARQLADIRAGVELLNRLTA